MKRLKERFVCDVAEICSENEIFGNRRREKVLILKKYLVGFLGFGVRLAVLSFRDGGANLRHSSLAERKVRE